MHFLLYCLPNPAQEMKENFFMLPSPPHSPTQIAHISHNLLGLLNCREKVVMLKKGSPGTFLSQANQGEEKDVLRECVFVSLRKTRAVPGNFPV